MKYYKNILYDIFQKPAFEQDFFIGTITIAMFNYKGNCKVADGMQCYTMLSMLPHLKSIYYKLDTGEALSPYETDILNTSEVLYKKPIINDCIHQGYEESIRYFNTLTMTTDNDNNESYVVNDGGGTFKIIPKNPVEYAGYLSTKTYKQMSADVKGG